MENKRILVIGGTGFIGRKLVKRLLDYGLDVTLLVRLESKNRVPSGYKKVVGDLLDKVSLIENVKNYDLVIDLASVVRSVDKSKYNENVVGLRNLIEAMHYNKVNSLIYFSSINAATIEKGSYAKSKERCEELIKKSNLKHSILRPGYVYDIDTSNDFATIAKMIKLFGVAPVIGKGDFRFQPIFVGDLVGMLVDLVNGALGRGLKNNLIEIGGKEVISINKVISGIEKILRKKSFSIHVPVLLVRLFERFVPFDVKGYEEDKLANVNALISNGSFKEDLEYICYLV